MESEIPTPSPGALLALVKASIKHQDHLVPLLKSYWYLGRKRIRVSMASLIRFEVGSCYIVSRNRHRAELFSPFGGVIKYRNSAKAFLETIEFEREAKASKDQELEYDLRGYIPVSKFGPFMTWFKSRMGREQDAVLRELREEFEEAEIPSEIAKVLLDAKYELLRRIHEGPYGNNSLSYASFRYLEIYYPSESDAVTDALKILAELAKDPKSQIRCVSKSCIESMRNERGEPIAGSARYFYTSKWSGHEPVPFR